MKLGFVLLSSSAKPQPSTRIAVLNMLPYLREAGIHAELVYDPKQESETPNLEGLAKRLIAECFDVVYFQKVRGASVKHCVQELSNAGIRTVYGVCDLVDAAMADLVDRTLVVTQFLKSLYPVHQQQKIRVVHDGIEHPEIEKTNWSLADSGKGRLRAVLVTSANLTRLPIMNMPPAWLDVTIIGKYAAADAWSQRLREAKWAFAAMKDWRARAAYIRFLAQQRIQTVKWQRETVYSAMQSADIGIIPIESDPATVEGTTVPIWQVKSENRLTLKMAIGLPVIATPIPAYEAVVESGRNAFLANSRADWIKCLQNLRDPDARREMGQAARASVINRYSMKEQARLLIDAIQSL
jgi:glycosyltransferase involved in cell wall biosynthesis